MKGSNGRQRRKRLPGNRRSHPARGSIEERLQRLIAGFRSLAREMVRGRAEAAGSRLLEQLVFELRLDLERDGTREEARRIRALWSAALERAQLARAAFLPGRVHCFWCSSSRCEHSAPPEADRVFDGYAPTGRPRWIPFGELCFDLRDERSERLLEESGGIVALFAEGERLKTVQIDEFGRDSPIYDIIGQVVAGYFPSRRGEARIAATFQVVGSRGGPASPRLSLNIIAAPDLYDESGGLRDPDLAGMVLGARKRLLREESRLAGVFRHGGTPDPQRAVARIMRDLARDLDHHYRIVGRRTQHAQRRSAQNNRPTESAFPEARAAADEQIYEDRGAGTLIVLGRRGRVHVFGRSGKHITSVRMGGDEVRRRKALRRWCPAPAAALAAFRAALARSGGRPGDAGAAEAGGP